MVIQISPAVPLDDVEEQLDADLGWLWGVFISIVGTVLTSLGLAVQKYSHKWNASQNQNLVYFRQPWWLAGFAVFLGGQCLNLLSMALTPQMMLSCLGALAPVFNLAFARCLLRERIYTLECWTIAGMIGGAILVICSTPVDRKPRSTFGMDEIGTLLAPVYEPRFLIFSITLAFAIACVGTLIRVWSKDHMAFFWVFSSAACYGQTVTFFKCLMELVVKVHPPWGDSRPYIVLGIALVLVLAQFHALNLALITGRAMFVVPVTFSCSFISQIITAEFAFRELSHIKHRAQLIILAVGVLLILVCIVTMMRFKIRWERETGVGSPQKGSDAADDESTQVEDITDPMWPWGNSDDAADGTVADGTAEPSTEAAQLHRTEAASTVTSPQEKKSTRVSSLDPEAFPESFPGHERTYTVSIAGPQGIA